MPSAAHPPASLTNSQASHPGALLFEPGLACVEVSGIQGEDLCGTLSVTRLDQKSCLVKKIMG